jgi:cytochrome P450
MLLLPIAQFEMMEGHLLLAALAQRVTFELAPGQQIMPEPMITLRPKDGIKMIVHCRRGSE